MDPQCVDLEEGLAQGCWQVEIVPCVGQVAIRLQHS